MIKAKKSLGQNFLKSLPAIKKIVEAGEVTEEDTILEIGPGKGALTAKLLEKAGKVIAIEKDRELFAYLSDKFATEINEGKLILTEADILEMDPPAGKYKIISNIPYNITGAILKKFLTATNQPERMVLLVQHEVAKRIVSEKGSILSISVKAYGEPKIILKVPARYFSPAPKVDSAVIRINNISCDFFRKNSLKEENFWEIVKLGFAHKRKKLFGNLKNASFNKIESLSEKRAEDLTLFDWLALIKQDII
jgi:16S rRNA (adenine1518-N6/adenine1519-N6)-dimethyltransferase